MASDPVQEAIKSIESLLKKEIPIGMLGRPPFNHADRRIHLDREMNQHASLETCQVWATIDSVASESPERTAIVEPGVAAISYADLRRQILAIEAKLRNNEVNPGSRVAVCMPAGASALVATIAVTKRFACVPCNPGLTQAELTTLFEQVKPRVVVVATPQTGGTEASRDQSLVKSVAEKLQIRVMEAGWNSGESNLVSTRASSEDAAVDLSGIALLAQTSATSGRAKVVMHTGKSLQSTFEATRRALQITSDDCVLLMSPLFHGQGMISAMAQLMAGGKVITTRGFDASQFSQWVSELKVTWYTCGPTTHRGILQHLRANPFKEQTSLRFVRSSGASLDPNLAMEMNQALGVPLLNAYGLTETGAVTSCTPGSLCMERPGSVGQSIGPKIRILNGDGQTAPPGVEGEIALSGASVMMGYLDDPAATEEAFLQEWFRSGDLGYVDQEGFLYINGRLKEIINRGGQKIVPEEVDATLALHPAVREVATFAVPHPTLGEDVACAVVPLAGATIDETELRRFAGQRISFHKMPRKVFFVDALPRGTTGKVQRRLLAERFRNSDVGSIRSGDCRGERAGGDAIPGTRMEKHLVEIWARILNRDDLRAHEDFFAAGGDSLGAMTMLAEVDARFGSDTLSRTGEFFDQPTIAFLATLAGDERVVARTDSASSEMTVYPVLADGREASLFCIPPDGHEGLYFRRMANWLTLPRPVSIVRPRNKSFASESDLIGDWAQRVAAVLRAAHPQRPYFLCGYCFGGIIAFETARLLSGDPDLRGLILFDVPTPGYPRPMKNWRVWAQRVIADAKAVLADAPTARSKLKSRLRGFLRRATWLAVQPIHGMAQPLRRFTVLRWLGAQAQEGYLPLYRIKSLNCPILHLLSNDDRILFAASRYGWRDVASAGITERFVPLHHLKVFAESNLPILVGEIEGWMTRHSASMSRDLQV